MQNILIELLPGCIIWRAFSVLSFLVYGVPVLNWMLKCIGKALRLKFFIAVCFLAGNRYYYQPRNDQSSFFFFWKMFLKNKGIFVFRQNLLPVQQHPEVFVHFACQVRLEISTCFCILTGCHNGWFEETGLWLFNMVKSYWTSFGEVT